MCLQNILSNCVLSISNELVFGLRSVLDLVLKWSFAETYCRPSDCTPYRVVAGNAIADCSTSSVILDHIQLLEIIAFLKQCMRRLA